MAPKVFITQSLPREWYAPLLARCRVEVWKGRAPIPRAALVRGVRRADALWCFLCDRIDEQVVVGAPRLRVIGNCAAGFNNVDLKSAKRKGMLVANTPGVLTDATADLTWALLLSVVRRIPEGDRLVREGKFRGWKADLLLGADLAGRTLGIIGLGRIGRAVAKRARGFGMRVVGIGSRSSRRALESLLKRADLISLHVPLTSRTRHLIGPREFRLMKSTAYLINTARGPVVDEKALVRALRAGRIAGAGLDVFEREPRVEAGLKRLPNVVMAPHAGSATERTRSEMARLTCRNILAGLAGRRPPYLVDLSKV